MTEQMDSSVVEHQDLAVVEATGSGYGQINIHDNVIAVIAHETAKRVPGVVELQGSLADGLAGMIGKTPKDKGIRIEKENEELLTIDLAVVLEYGVCIPEVCVQLQSAVKEAVENMTGKQIYAVNVVVQGIRGPEAKKDGE